MFNKQRCPSANAASAPDLKHTRWQNLGRRNFVSLCNAKFCSGNYDGTIYTGRGGAFISLNIGNSDASQWKVKSHGKYFTFWMTQQTLWHSFQSNSFENPSWISSLLQNGQGYLVANHKIPSNLTKWKFQVFFLLPHLTLKGYFIKLYTINNTSSV